MFYTKFLINYTELKKNAPNTIMKYFTPNFYFKNVTPYSEKVTYKTKNFTPNSKTFTPNLFFFAKFYTKY